MTFDIDEYWSITVTHADKIGPKEWRATAQAYRRDTQKPVGHSLTGFGSTQNAADTAAQHAAEDFVSTQGRPEGWKRR